MSELKSRLPKDYTFPKTVNILGSIWAIIVKTYDEDRYFADHKADGYCNGAVREIAILDLTTHPAYEREDDIRSIFEWMKDTLRHEIVHAFFKESGLDESSFSYGGSWAKNEEMVDWIAHQGEKIFHAFEKCGCLKMTGTQSVLRTKGRTSSNGHGAKRVETISA